MNLYVRLGMLCWAMLWASTTIAAERFGGIEIGAKGIKTTVVEVNEDGSLSMFQLGKDITNTSLSRLDGVNFKEAKIQDVAHVVTQFKEALMNEMEVPATNISCVASSGVPTFASNYQDLARSIQETAGLTLTRIDAREEAALTNLALIPAAQRTTAMVVDVGSGNTKGGTFVTGTGTTQDFIGLDAPFGTATFAQEVEAAVNQSGGDAVSISKSLAQEIVGAALQAQIKAKPVLGERKIVLFSGGSVWAMMTMLKPETALDPFAVVTKEDIDNYRQLMESSYPNYPPARYLDVKDEETRNAAKGDYDRITGGIPDKAPIFSELELLAGSAILAEIADAMEYKNRAVFFDRKAITAWITSKVTPENLRHNIPVALGRSLPNEADALVAIAAPAVTPNRQVPPTTPRTTSPVAPTRDSKTTAPNAVVPKSSVSANEPRVSMLDQRRQADQSVLSQPYPVSPGLSSIAPPEACCGQYVDVCTPVSCWEPSLVSGCCRRGLFAWRRSCCGSSVSWVRSRVWIPTCSTPISATGLNVNAAEHLAPDVPQVSVLETETIAETVPVMAPIDLSKFHVWHNQEGIPSNEPMKVLSVVNGHCIFEKPTGQWISYPLQKLSQADQWQLKAMPGQQRECEFVYDLYGHRSYCAAFIMAGEGEAIYLSDKGQLLHLQMDELTASSQVRVAKHSEEAEMPLIAATR
ncbi:hypothetical protein AB1L30_13245 [Bremerella sp. JC817]|uniref:hypothetical protein n=1 Tax=Bremerella sp. JC817 TaxID=3231756 RepID=UPI00345A1F66